MTLSAKAQSIYDQVSKDDMKHGDVKKMAKDIKKDHDLALELWPTGLYFARQLALLILDKTKLSQEVIDALDKGIQEHPYDERNHLSDWLMANQLMKSKKTIALMESWEHSPSPMQRRLFWYYQGRLRWMGKTPPPNTNALVTALEEHLENEEPEVQWAMNFTAGFIGIYELEFRPRCVALGKRLELFKEQKVPKGCTPNYLPEFIRIESEKRGV